jgi:hypothetical protein
MLSIQLMELFEEVTSQGIVAFSKLDVVFHLLQINRRRSVVFIQFHFAIIDIQGKFKVIVKNQSLSSSLKASIISAANRQREYLVSQIL